MTLSYLFHGEKKKGREKEQGRHPARRLVDVPLASICSGSWCATSFSQRPSAEHGTMSWSCAFLGTVPSYRLFLYPDPFTRTNLHIAPPHPICAPAAHFYICRTFNSTLPELFCSCPSPYTPSFIYSVHPLFECHSAPGGGPALNYGPWPPPPCHFLNEFMLL